VKKSHDPEEEPLPLILRDGMEEPLLFRVTDLKQWMYCRRIVFFLYCLPHIRPVTYLMEEGAWAHEAAWKREKRRSLRAYGLEDGERLSEVLMVSKTLHLVGKVDMIILRDAEVIPVDYKDTLSKPGRNVRIQLAAYGLLAAEKFDRPARRGFMYSLPRRKATEIKFTAALRKQVEAAVSAMLEAVSKETMPDPPASRRPCINCEFRRFCNDVL